MPSAIWVPEYAITRTGREVPFDILLYCIYDLAEFNWISPWQYEEMRFWISSYQNGGALPSLMTFKCPWSGDYVGFTAVLDGIWELYIAAKNDEDITDDEDEENDENDDPLEGVDLHYPYPTNIGRFNVGRNPQLRNLN